MMKEVVVQDITERMKMLNKGGNWCTETVDRALEARYLGQLESQYLYPLGSPGGPAIPQALSF
jgi:hypothetical protein